MPRQNDKAEEFAYYWRALAPAGSPQPEREYHFIDGRNYKADFCWPRPQYKVIVEIDGANWMTRIHPRTGIPIAVGRHTRDEDNIKCNLATQHGWRVLHYTPAMLKKDPQGVIKQVCETLANGKH